MGGNNEFFENFERNKYLKKLPSMQRVKQPIYSIVGKELRDYDVHSCPNKSYQFFKLLFTN